MTTELKWEEALAAFEQQRKETKTVSFPLKAGMLTFKIRMLTQQEKDRIESKYLSRLKRNRGNVADPDDLNVLKVEHIKLGVVEGPPGWQPSTQNIEALPAYIRDALADEIGAFQGITEEDAEAFRGVGEGAPG
jgi:hypothetical protein